jgi:hypothetical protein
MMACKVQQSNTQYTDWQTNREIKVWRMACEASQYVVRLYDASYQLNKRQVRMYTELCEGGDAHKLLVRIAGCRAERRIHPMIIYHVALQIAWGLADIQAKNILHRDLKTDNVLMTMTITNEMNQSLWQLSEKGSLDAAFEPHLKAYLDSLYEKDQRLCVLTDFGLSRDETNRERSTYTMGPDARWTVGTSAPELEFYNHQSPMADIYSWGVLIYTLTAQRGPPTAGTPFERLPTHYHPNLQRLIDECLDHDPLKRPTAGDMVKRLLALKDMQGGQLDEVLKKDRTRKYQEQSKKYAAEQARLAELEILAAQRDAEAAAERLAQAVRWRAHLVEQAKLDKAPAQIPGRTGALSKADRAAHLAAGGNNINRPAAPGPGGDLRANRPAPARPVAPGPGGDLRANRPAPARPGPAPADNGRLVRPADPGAREREAAAQRKREDEARRLAEDQNRRQAEVARQAEEKRRREEGAALVEAQKRQREQEAARAAEEKRRLQEKEAARAAEEKRRLQEREAEDRERRRRREAEKQADEQRRVQEKEAARAAEEKRRLQEREAEDRERRRRREAERQVEEQRRLKDKEAEDRRRWEEEKLVERIAERVLVDERRERDAKKQEAEEKRRRQEENMWRAVEERKARQAASQPKPEIKKRNIADERTRMSPPRDDSNLGHGDVNQERIQMPVPRVPMPRPQNPQRQRQDTSIDDSRFPPPFPPALRAVADEQRAKMKEKERR